VSEAILVGKSAREWFREMVGDALAHRRLRIQDVTEFYLVNLLADRCAAPAAPADGEGARVEPLAEILLRALQADRRTRATELRRLGDTALFVSGFFGDSLARSIVDVDYYIAMGARAYGTLRETERGPGLDALFAELSERFETFVDLFAEIAEVSQLRSNRGLVRLYERWQHTRSERVAQLLRERGVALFSGPGAPAAGPRGGWKQ
jgi:hypothetical protein